MVPAQRRLSGAGTLLTSCVLAAPALVATASGGATVAHSSPHRAGSAGVTVELPVGWHFFADGVAPRSMPYADPLVRIVVASTQIRAFPQGCKAETFRFARGGVGLMVVEWVHPQKGVVWPRRPPHFTAHLPPVRKSPAVECWPGPGGSVQFVASGRHFAVYLLLAPHVSLTKAAQVRAVLDTLAVRPNR